jgi:16S rRNA (cytosine967-C5)-methyltransferase
MSLISLYILFCFGVSDKRLLKEAWTLAIEALSWMGMQRLSERLAMTKTVNQLDINDPDAIKFAHMLVCETVRRQNFIDSFINEALKPDSITEFNLGIQSFLQLYVYQTRIAKNWPKIDIEEAENIARMGRSILGWKALRKIEHVLGVLLTQRPVSVLEGASDEERIGLMTFHPAWFVKYCFRLFGRKEAITMLEANMQPPPTYVRLNTLRADENAILQKLSEERIRVKKVEQLKYAYAVLDTKKPLTCTVSFREGLFYIQDKASCFAAEVANPRPGMIVLDVCAAPGAKTTYLAQLMQNRGAIYSLDYSKRRMNVWKNEVALMGVEIAVPTISDGSGPLPLTIEADMVVLDPPCTSTGSFGKLPSAKWRLTRRSVEKMAQIQWQMINNCAERVKPGGALIYSTCSITVEENEIIVERFLKWHPEFSLTDISSKMGLPGLRGLEECRRLYPHIHQCSGFFIARLSRGNL